MAEPKFHLLDDFGIHKSTIQRNLDADYGVRDDDWSLRVRALLQKPTEMYTLDEIADLIRALSSARDNQVAKHPDDFVDSHGRPSLEVRNSEDKLERQSALEERLRIFRARVENAASADTSFSDAPPPQGEGADAWHVTLTQATPVQPPQRIPTPERESLTRPILAAIGLLALLVVLGVLVWTITAPSSGPLTPAPVSSVNNDGDWARIQAAGKITIGTTADFPPFSYHGNNLPWDGFDIQLMNEIGKRLGLQVSYVDIPFEGLTGALQLNQIDAAIAAISVTPERASYVDFTNIYYASEDGLIARQDSNLSQIRVVDEMAKLKIGVQRGSVYETWLNTALVNSGKMPIGNFFAYSQIDQALSDLRANRLDVVVMDYLPAQETIKQGGVKLVGRGLARQNYAMAVRKGTVNLRDNLNQALAQMQMDGTVAKLAQQYLGVTPAPIIPTATPVLAQATATAVPPPRCIDGLTFVQHLTLEDNLTVLTKMNPGQPFTKSWRIRNIGTCPWDTSYSADFAQGIVGAARMGGVPTNLGRIIQPGETYDLPVQLYAPIIPGSYQAWWTMHNAQGVPFGQMLYVGIQVPSPATPTPLPTQTPVPGISFTADRTTVQAGEPVVLTWNVTNVKAIFFYMVGEPWEQRGVAGQGSRQVFLQNTTVYELRVVKLDDQVETRQIRIDVTPLPPAAPGIARFTVDPSFQIFAGQCVNLTWDVQGLVTLVTVTSNGTAIWDNAPVRGTLQNCPPGVGIVSYVISATGPGGSNRAQRDITVIVQPTATPPLTVAPPLTPTPTATPLSIAPIINVFAINPGAVVKQQCATLMWDVSGNVTSIRIFRGGIVVLDNGMLAGTAQECPMTAGNLAYRIEARNLAGQVTTRELTLIVNP